jgi:hypothetical protein
MTCGRGSSPQKTSAETTRAFARAQEEARREAPRTPTPRADRARPRRAGRLSLHDHLPRLERGLRRRSGRRRAGGADRRRPRRLPGRVHDRRRPLPRPQRAARHAAVPDRAHGLHRRPDADARQGARRLRRHGAGIGLRACARLHRRPDRRRHDRDRRHAAVERRLGRGLHPPLGPCGSGNRRGRQARADGAAGNDARSPPRRACREAAARAAPTGARCRQRVSRRRPARPTWSHAAAARRSRDRTGPDQPVRRRRGRGEGLPAPGPRNPAQLSGGRRQLGRTEHAGRRGARPDAGALRRR